MSERKTEGKDHKEDDDEDDLEEPDLKVHARERRGERDERERKREIQQSWRWSNIYMVVLARQSCLQMFKCPVIAGLCRALSNHQEGSTKMASYYENPIICRYLTARGCVLRCMVETSSLCQFLRYPALASITPLARRD